MEHGISISPDIQQTVTSSFAAFAQSLSNIPKEIVAADTLNPEKAICQANVLSKFVSLRNKKILEIGAGFGVNVATWSKVYGADVFGLEPDGQGFESSCSIAWKLMTDNGLDASRIICAAGESIPYPSDSFDIVYSTNVLEHVRDPEQTLAEALRVLKPGGTLQFIYPNYHSFFDGHYSVFHPPILFKGLFPLWIHYVCRRTADFAKTLNTQLNHRWTTKQIAALKNKYNFVVLSTGKELFFERMTQINFTPWVGLRLVQTALQMCQRARINWIMAVLLNLLGCYTPIVLTIRKEVKTRH